MNGEARLEPLEPPAGEARPIVVCVDDEPQILRSLGRVLRGEAYEFRSTTDPEQALDWVRREQVALVIADYKMPVMSGTTLLQLVKASSPRTIRLMLTGYTGESLVIMAGESGLMDILGKPWNDDALRETIRRRLADGR